MRIANKLASRRQQGFSGAAVIVAIILIGLAVLLARGLSRTDVSTQAETLTVENLRRSSEALVAYAGLNQSLPCAAPGNTDTGIADPGCAATTGVLPWSTLGLQRQQALDGWGRKISYRVAAGLTTVGSTSAVDCNKDVPSAGYPQYPLAAGMPCSASPHVHSQAQERTARGPMPSINDRGTTQANVAFVLVSHGESGAGAFLAEGGTQVAAPPAGGAELTNTLAPVGNTYQIAARSAPGVPPTAVAHFDDVLAYKTYDQLVEESKLVARSWGAVLAGSQSFTRAEVTAAAAAAGSTLTGNNTGAQSLTFGTGADRVTVAAFGSTARNVSSGIPGSGATSGEGIGVITTGGTTFGTSVNSSSNERLVFTFFTPARSLGITVVDFGTSFGGDFERVQITFLLAGAPVASFTKSACTAGNVQANYSIDPGVTYDGVEVKPITTTPSGNNSSLLVGSIAACAASIPASQCVAPTAVAANNCP